MHEWYTTIAEFAYCWLIATSIPRSTQPPQRWSRATRHHHQGYTSTAVTKKTLEKSPNSSRLLATRPSPSSLSQASESPQKMGSQKRPASQASPVNQNAQRFPRTLTKNSTSFSTSWMTCTKHTVLFQTHTTTRLARQRQSSKLPSQLSTQK